MRPSRMQEVLDAAFRLFSEKGYDKTSMRDLCRETNLTTAGLYHYITSKQDLFIKVEKKFFSDFLKMFDNAKKSKDPIKRLETFIREYCKITLTTPQMAHLIMERTFAEGDEKVAAESKERKKIFFNGVRELLSQIKEAGLADDCIDITVATFSLIGVLFWTTLWYNPERRLTEVQLVDAVSRLFFKGYLKEDYRS